MTNIFEELGERIRGEMPELERAADRALRAWVHAQQTPGEYAYLDSVALNLHAFYSGVERLFELIARHVDRALPGGDTWHRDLLYQMAGDLPEVRPAVVSQETVQTLDEFRRFRHVVRRVYTINLAPEKMASLMSGPPYRVGHAAGRAHGLCRLPGSIGAIGGVHLSAHEAHRTSSKCPGKSFVNAPSRPPSASCHLPAAFSRLTALTDDR